MQRGSLWPGLVFLFSCWNASVSAVLSICKTKAPTLTDCPPTTQVGMCSLGPEPCLSHERHLRFCLYYASQECWVSRHRRAHTDSLLLLNSFHICFYIMWAQAVLRLSLPLSFFFFFCITLSLITLKCTQLGVGIIVVVQASLLPHYTHTFQLGLFDFSIIVWGPTILSHPVLHCFYEWMIFHCVVKSHFWLFLIVGHVGYFWFLPIQHKATYRVLFCFGGMWGVYSASWVCTRKCNSENIWRLCV